MKKLTTILSIILIIVACNKKKSPDNDVITIDVIKALQNPKTVKLSEIVKTVEIIELESGPDSYFEMAQSIHVGKNKIMIGDYREGDVHIFDRSGKFLNNVGKHGKGPGEIQSYLQVTTAMDKNENYVVIGDYMAKKLILYSSSGKFIKEKSFTKDNPSYFIESLFFVDDNHFGVMFRRSGVPGPESEKIIIYDLDLQVTKNIFELNENKFLDFKDLTYYNFKPGSNGFIYWEVMNDTVFYIDKEYKQKAVYNFYYSEDGITEKLFQNRKKWTDHYFIWNVNDLPGYLIANGSLKGGGEFKIIYDKQYKESFSIPVNNSCSELNSPNFENDIFGFEHISFYSYQPESNITVVPIQMEYMRKKVDLDCLRKKVVKNPELRNKIADKIENFTGEENPLILLLHLK